MSDINATLKKRTEEFQLLREDINSIRQWKSKKKRRKLSRHSLSSERCHQTAIEEGKDLPFEVEKGTLLVPPVPKPDLPLKAENNNPPVKPLGTVRRFALKVEQATDRESRVGVTHDLEAGIIPIPEAERDILDLVVDHLT